MKTCTVDSCDREQYARRLCLRHYRRLAKYGSATDLRALKTRPSDVSIEDWFWSRVEKRVDGCWVWTAAIHSEGYGQLWDGSKVAYAHRLAFEFTQGRIDDGMEIDHSCRVRNCVNPDHLRIATRKTNMENVVNNQGSASGIRGVHKVRGGRWRAAVGHNGVNHSGGEYRTIEEAARAAIALRNQLFTNNVHDHVSPAPCAPCTGGKTTDEVTLMRVCSEPNCPLLVPKAEGGKCRTHRAAYEKRRGTRQQRGYGATHDRIRAEWAPRVATGRVICWRCGERIADNEPWDLGHDENDRLQYRGPEHASRCNRSAAGRKSHQP